MMHKLDFSLVYLMPVDAVGIVFDGRVKQQVPWSDMDGFVEWLSANSPPPLRTSDGIVWVHLHDNADQRILGFLTSPSDVRILALLPDWSELSHSMHDGWARLQSEVGSVKKLAEERGQLGVSAVADGRVTGVVGPWRTIWEAKHE